MWWVLFLLFVAYLGHERVGGKRDEDEEEEEEYLASGARSSRKQHSGLAPSWSSNPVETKAAAPFETKAGSVHSSSPPPPPLLIFRFLFDQTERGLAKGASTKIGQNGQNFQKIWAKNYTKPYPEIGHRIQAVSCRILYLYWYGYHRALAISGYHSP